MSGGGQRALVIGGGVAGMQAAIDLADNGVYTYLIERDSELGGRAYRLSRTYRTHECKADGCCMDYCKECIFHTDVFDHPSPRYWDWAERKGGVRLPSDTLLYHVTRMLHRLLQGMHLHTQAGRIAPEHEPGDFA